MFNNIKQFIRHGRQAAKPNGNGPSNQHHGESFPTDSSLLTTTEATFTTSNTIETDSQPTATQYTHDNTKPVDSPIAGTGVTTKRHQRRDEYSKLASDLVDEENKQKLLQRQKQTVTRYQFLDKLGEGAFSTVYKAKDLQTGQDVAIKLIKKYELDQAQQASVLKEVTIMRQLQHPNIVQFLNFIETEEYYYIVQELVGGGEIFNEIVKYTYFSEDLSRHVLVQMARGIEYLHEKVGVVHRDLKPENIFFNPIQFLPLADPSKKRLRRSDDSNTKLDEGEFIPNVGAGGIGTIKIGDFGLSKQLTTNDTLATPCGTIGYTAPEIVKDMRYSKEVDMWALGCVLYILLCGFPPFFNDQIEVLTRKVAKGEFEFLSPWWDEISFGAKNCVQKLLLVNPIERYTIKDLLNDPWVKEFTDRCDKFEQLQQQQQQASTMYSSGSVSPIENSAYSHNVTINGVHSIPTSPTNESSGNTYPAYQPPISYQPQSTAATTATTVHHNHHHRQQQQSTHHNVPSSGPIPSYVMEKNPALYSPAAIAMKEAFDISTAVHRLGEEAAYYQQATQNQGQQLGQQQVGGKFLPSLNEDEEMGDVSIVEVQPSSNIRRGRLNQPASDQQPQDNNMKLFFCTQGGHTVNEVNTPFELNLGTATILGRRKKKMLVA